MKNENKTTTAILISSGNKFSIIRFFIGKYNKKMNQ